MSFFKILDWDSNFFGFTVSRILPHRITANKLTETIEKMKKEGVTLAYWASDPEDKESQSCAQSINAFLADRKVTYVISSEEIQANDRGFAKIEALVEEYPDVVPTAELLDLALQAGEFSRFKIDPRISEDRFVELYTLWIRRSVAREIADAVFVIRREGKIAGMVTVGEKAGRADIGLIAVDASLRGQSAGTALVKTAQQWGVKKGYSAAQVVTQGDNLPACRFYEKCGYRVDKVENIYHLWIN
jgi:dTDP-4-amino-4,6-dideoxy-D-galactose acyltransferase